MKYYFDHTATSFIEQDVIEFLAEQLINNNYNPAALYTSGIEAAASIAESARTIAEILGAEPQEVIITSGATESINTALKGIVFSPNPKYKRIITSAGEHPATNETLKFISRQLNYTIDYCPLNAKGEVNLTELESLLATNQYDLLTLIHVNNVLGSVNPLAQIVKLRNQYQPDLPIHLDAVQTLGKIPFNFNKMSIELASFSLHKLGGPKGIGILLKDKATRLEPLIHGGGQQNNLRSGTENPALVATVAYILERMHKKIEQNNQVITELKGFLLEQLKKESIKHQVISPEDAVPHIISIAFPELRAETLLNILAREGIEVSIGSACSSKKSERNQVLQELNLPHGLDQYVLRISLDKSNSQTEISDLVRIIKTALDKYAV
ncbi:MAG TPA: cysteine desulfurase [Clostridiaceae bacterium]|nr:cysteine desulfurase [Clostridiaceae bacterium]